MKTACITVAALAGIATATPYSTPFNDAQTTDTTVPAGAVATMTIDLSGVESWDWFNDPDNYHEMFNFAPNTHITGVGWDLTIQTSGPSWMSEVTIDLYNSNYTGLIILNPGWSAAYNGTESFSSGGIIDLIGNGDFLLNADGLLHMNVYESLDDNDNAVDATFLAGSSLYVQYVIPTPGTIALLGLTGIFTARRRR